LISTSLSKLESQALNADLLLRIQVRRPLGVWATRIVVAEKISVDQVKILGEMKCWAYKALNGLQLDTMRVNSKSSPCIGHLIWSATMAWALEETPCINARLLAIRDEERQHKRLVRYFERRGFRVFREVGSSPIDLPVRVVWGGAGSLMSASCEKVLEKSSSLWISSVK
tara:strand:+ start:743 stop:1252 length:510 start_codon:yes stop_codon:yes gene_type:complete